MTYILEGTRQKLIQGVLPGVSFIQAERLVGVDVKDYATTPPDLAIEIISSTEHPSEVMAKVTAYLQCGVEEVWTVYPDSTQIVVYSNQDAPSIYKAGDFIRLRGALMGLSVEVDQIFLVM